MENGRWVERVTVFAPSFPDRLFTRDEYVDALRRWQKPTTWGIAFNHVLKFKELAEVADRLNQQAAANQSEEAEHYADEAYQLATSWYDSAIRKTKDYTWIRNTTRELAPRLLRLFPVFEFFSPDTSPPGNWTELCRQMAELEGEFLEYERAENGSNLGASRDGAKKSLKSPRSNIPPHYREFERIIREEEKKAAKKKGHKVNRTKLAEELIRAQFPSAKNAKQMVQTLLHWERDQRKVKAES